MCALGHFIEALIQETKHGSRLRSLRRIIGKKA